MSSRSAVAPDHTGMLYGATKAAALNYAIGFGRRYPTTVAIVGITDTRMFAAAAEYHGRAEPGSDPRFARPGDVARNMIDAVEAGDAAVVADRDALRDVAAYSWWLANAPVRD